MKMSQHLRECWLNVSQNPSHRHYRSILAVFTMLVAGALAVGFRVYLCQAQAYAMILLTIVAAIMALLHNAQRRDSIVKIKKEVYCADLSDVSHIAVAPGRLSGEVASSYERLYFTRMRTWVPLVVWLIWVAYGSLFHSGKHVEHSPHELLIDLAGVGEQVPATLRVARIYLLAFCGIGSVLLSLFYRRRDERNPESTVLKMSEQEQAWHSRLWILFSFLLFIPSVDSTAQGLLPLRLVARTTMFYVLFVLSESFNRLLHHERWLRNYKPFTEAVLVAIQIALGRAKPRKLKEQKERELAAALESMEPPSPIVNPRKSNAHDMFTSEIVKYCAVLQSAWVLVANDSVYPIALLQTLFLLFMHAKVRRTVIATSQSQANDLFVVNSKGTPVLPVTSRNNSSNNLVSRMPDAEPKCPLPPPSSAEVQGRTPVLGTSSSASDPQAYSTTSLASRRQSRSATDSAAKKETKDSSPTSPTLPAPVVTSLISASLVSAPPTEPRRLGIPRQKDTTTHPQAPPSTQSETRADQPDRASPTKQTEIASPTPTTSTARMTEAQLRRLALSRLQSSGPPQAVATKTTTTTTATTMPNTQPSQ